MESARKPTKKNIPQKKRHACPKLTTNGLNCTPPALPLSLAPSVSKPIAPPITAMVPSIITPKMATAALASFTPAPPTELATYVPMRHRPTTPNADLIARAACFSSCSVAMLRYLARISKKMEKKRVTPKMMKGDAYRRYVTIHTE